jgi:Putative polyhydroxyalkanoic acid system protein (PHA_gran_rgn)
MAQIKRNYPGRSADEIYVKVHEVMNRIAQKLSLDYQRDEGEKTGQVSKMGIRGSYKVTEGEVVVDLKFPMIVPGTMKKKVQEDIERKLDGLFA